MGHFDHLTDFIVKMMKCRPDVHQKQGHEGVADTPTDHGSKLPSVVCSSSAQRGILNGVTFQRFAPDYD